MRPDTEKIVSLSAAVSPLIIIIVYYNELSTNMVVLSATLGLLALLLALRLPWLSYILSISGLSVLAVYLNNVFTLLMLLYAIFSSFVGIRSPTPLLGAEAKKLVPAIIITFLSIFYASLLIYTLSNSNIQGFKKLGETGVGDAIIYGFVALFAVSLTYGYYSGHRMVPQEALFARKIYTTITPDNGFRITLYIASIAPSITYHDPVYVVAAFISYFIKLLAPLTHRVKNIDILVYSLTYFVILKMLGAGW